MGPPAVVFDANKTFDSQLKEVGLELQPAKSKCYISAEHRNGQWDIFGGEIPNGTLKDKNGNDITEDGLPVHGILVCNVPVGSEAYVKEYLSQMADKIEFQYRDISEMLDPVKWCHPEIPTKQMLWLLTVVCLQNLADY